MHFGGGRWRRWPSPQHTHLSALFSAPSRPPALVRCPPHRHGHPLYPFPTLCFSQMLSSQLLAPTAPLQLPCLGSCPSSCSESPLAPSCPTLQARLGPDVLYSHSSSPLLPQNTLSPTNISPQRGTEVWWGDGSGKSCTWLALSGSTGSIHAVETV